MSELKMNVVIDGQTYTTEQLDVIEYERERHVLQELIHLGAKVKDGEKDLSYDDINFLGMEDAKRILIDTKVGLGEQGTLDLYKDSIEAMNQLWRKVSKEYRKEAPMQESYAYMEIEGITIPQLQESIRSSINGEGTDAYSSNPEHFTDLKINGLAPNEKCGIETMGMFGGPLPVIVIFDPSMTGPAKVEDGWKVLTAGTSKLLDGTPRYDNAVHQVRPKENGFDLKMAVYFPAGIPVEMVKGHQIHLAIEFVEGLRNAYKKCNG